MPPTDARFPLRLQGSRTSTTSGEKHNLSPRRTGSVSPEPSTEASLQLVKAAAPGDTLGIRCSFSGKTLQLVLGVPNGKEESASAGGRVALDGLWCPSALHGHTCSSVWRTCSHATPGLSAKGISGWEKSVLATTGPLLCAHHPDGDVIHNNHWRGSICSHHSDVKTEAKTLMRWECLNLNHISLPLESKGRHGAPV